MPGSSYRFQQAYTQELLEAQTHQKNTVVVGTLYQINDLLSQFYNYDPSIFIVFNRTRRYAETMAEKMRSGKCEVAFLPDPYTYENEFTLLPFARDKFVAVLPSDHPMAGRDSLHVRELKNENFVSFMEGAYGDCAIKNLCNRGRFYSKGILQCGQYPVYNILCE